MAVNYISLVLDLYDGSGAPIGFGAVELAPTQLLTDVPDQQVIPRAPVTEAPGEAGLSVASILACDSTGPQPAGWAWQVSFPGVPGNPQPYAIQPFAGPAAFTATHATPAVFTWTPVSGGLSSLPNGTGVELSSGSLPGGFTAGTTYYVVASSGTTFSLASTSGGPPVASTASGSGSVTVVQYNLSALSAVQPEAQFQGYILEPSGTPAVGEVLAATAGATPQWSTLAALGALTNPMSAVGDTVYGATSGAVTRLPGNATTARKFWRQTGTGSASAAPVWDTLQAGDLPAVPGSLVGLVSLGSMSTPDTSNIQGLLNLTGKAVLQAGTFWIDQALQFPSSSQLAGAGKQLTTVKAVNSFAASQVGSNPGMVMLAGAGNTTQSGITVCDLTLDGNASSIASVPGYAVASSQCSPVGFNNVTTLVLERTGVINPVGYSMYLIGCTDVTVDGCRVISGQVATAYNQQDGIHVTDCTGVRLTRNYIDTGTHGGDDAIAIQGVTTGTSDVTVTGNVIEHAGAHGINLVLGGAAVTGVTVAGNTIANTQHEAVILSFQVWNDSARITDATVSGNVMRNIGLGGSSSGITLQDGTSVSGGGHIGAPGWADVTISANVLSGLVNTGGFGIYVTAGSTLHITDNILDGLDVLGGIYVGDWNASPSTSRTVTGYKVTGNTVNMSSSAASAPVGISVIDSVDGTVTDNTVTGPGTGVAGGIGIRIEGIATAPTGLVCNGNRVKAWAAAVTEVNSGNQPDSNTYAGNNTAGCTAGITATGTHDVVITGSLAGDVTGTLSAATVVKIQGVAITAAEATLVSDLNNAAARTATGTLLPGEETIFTGSAAAQTLSLPASPPSSSVNTVTNAASVSVTLAPGAGAAISDFGTAGNITIPAGYTFAVVYIGTTWFVQSAGPGDFAKSSALSIPSGGTGATSAAAAFNALSPMTTAGDTIYGGASGAATRLAGNTSTTRKFWRQTGTGSASAAPAWDTLQLADIPPAGPQMFPLRGGGEAAFSPFLANQNATSLASGVMLLSFGIAQVSEAIDHVSIPTGTGATGTTYAAYIVYTVDGSYNLTVAAETASNTSLWGVPFQGYNGINVSQALTASWAKQAGQLYAFGLLWVGTGTAPAIVSASGFAGDGGSSLAAGISAKVTGLSTLPGSVSAGSLAANALAPALVLLP